MPRSVQCLVSFALGVAISMGGMLLLLSRAEEVTTLMAIQAFAPIAILFSGFVALFIYRENVNKNRSDRALDESATHLSEAKALIERAFSVFVEDNEGIPENSNIVWRTTALLLLKGEDVGGKVSEPAHVTAWEGHKQYYALRFHRVLWANVEAFELDYFAPEGTVHDTSSICRKSIAAIFEFAHSVSDDFHVLDSMDPASIYASSSVPEAFLGLEEYISQQQEFWEKVQRLKGEKGSS